MKRLFFLLYLFFISSCLYPQKNLVIKGYIFNGEEAPIENVNVWIVKSNIGTISDNNGYFRIELNNNIFDSLKLSHLNYKPLLINIDTITDTLPLIIHLTKSVKKIDEVSIYARSIHKVNNNYQILDYNFINDTLIVLSENIYNKSYKIVLINKEMDTITKFILPSHLRLSSIFHDCFNNISIIGKDSVFLLQIKRNNISILNSFAKQVFMNSIGKFIFETKKYIVIKEQMSEYFIKYLAFDKVNRKLINFINIDEMLKERETYQYIQWLKKNGFKGDLTARLRFEKEIMNPPSKQPLIKLKDSIYYMRYSKNRIEIFNNELKRIKIINSKYSLNKGWKPIFITDSYQNKIYTIYKSKSNLIDVANINLKTGDINFKKRISVLFPINPQINNGFFYCIRSNHIKSNNELYRIKLDLNE